MDYLENYRKSHTHPVNRALHTVGIPTIVISILLGIYSYFFTTEQNLTWPLGLFVFGWVLQFIGHAFEGKWPSFFSNPLYLVVGIWWWVKKIFKR